MPDDHSDYTTRKNTNKTDQEIDEDSSDSSAGAVLNPANSPHVSEEGTAAAARVLADNGSKADGQLVKDEAKKIPKNPAAQKRDEEQKGQR
jgi:hypothetical protein